MNRLLLGLLCLIFSCSPKGIDIDIIEYQVYDVPAKSQVSVKVVIKDMSFTKKDLERMMYNVYDQTAKQKLKYHTYPTHIFLYAYRTKEDIQSANWVAKMEKVQNIEVPLEMRIK